MTVLVSESMAVYPESGDQVSNSTANAWNSGGWYQLNTGINQYADLEYFATLPSGFTASADLQMGTTSGADASWFYWGWAASPTTEGDSGGYLINRNDFGNSLEIRFNGSALTSVSYTKDLNWDTLAVSMTGQVITVSYLGAVVMTYTDPTVRTLPGIRYGWGARSGGTANTHNVRNLSMVIPTASTMTFRFYPRIGWTSRVPGALFQGSPDAGTTWVTIVAEPNQPVDSQWHRITVPATRATYNQFRYYSPSNGYGNIAELQFYDGTYGQGATQLGSVYPIASYTSGSNPPANAFDGSLTSFYEGNGANGQWVGIDLSNTSGSFVRLFPRGGEESRMAGAVFQGSNDFNPAVLTSGTWTTIASVSGTPAAGWSIYATSQPTTNFRYLRYYGGTGDYGNVAELEFYFNSNKLVPVATFGTPGSYGSGGNVYTNALDGNTGTYFDSAQANNNIIGIDTGVTPTVSHPGQFFAFF
jgi:hypothetical protein